MSPTPATRPRRSTRAGRNRRRRIPATSLVLLAVLAGCTTGTPPVPGPETPSPSTVASSPPTTPTPEIPVVASWVLDAGTQSPQEVRVALHGIRRTQGASVLDWSVTPLAGPGRHAGDPVGQKLSLGMERWIEQGYGLSLIDLEARTLYRPLDDDPQEWMGHNVIGCLCTRWEALENNFKIGTTRLLQAAFPEVPEDLTSIAVAVQGSPLIESVPVAGEGKLLSGPGLDLTVPAASVTPLTPEVEFSYPLDAGGAPTQRFSLHVDEVLAAPSSTTLRFTVTAVDDGPGFSVVPGHPVGDPALPASWWSVSPSRASGPGLRVDGATEAAPTLRAWIATVSQMEDQKIDRPLQESQPMQEALASEIAHPFSSQRLTTAGDAQAYIAHLPGISSDATTIDVVFPEDSLPPFTRVPVTRATPVPAFTQVDAGDVGTWAPGLGKEGEAVADRGWVLDDWPTPLPDQATIAAADSAVDELIQVRTDDVSVERRDEENVQVTLDATVSFEPDSAILTLAARATIARIAADIDRSSATGATVLVEGHVAGTDRGSAAVQHRLSQERADAVRDALTSSVTVVTSFESVGRGAEIPVAPNDTEDNRRKNRRVVVTYRQ